MRKILIPTLAILILSCSKNDGNDIENLVEDSSGNNAPVITTENLQITEHSLSGTSLGFINFSDADIEDELTLSITSDAFEINESTGEISVGPNAILDFETSPETSFDVSVFDGTIITEKNIHLTIENIEEYDILSAPQKELVAYFKYLTLKEASSNLTNIRKWNTPMKIYLDGNISSNYRTTVESVIEEYNALFKTGDFSISLVETSEESNTHIFLGDSSELENFWDDMFDVVGESPFSGYAITSVKNFKLNDSRIWVSNELESLLKHELGHALGLGHSNKCDTEKSFMCSIVTQNNDFLESDEDVLRFLYHKDMASGTALEDLNNAVGNLILLD